ncbi:MAG TPA: flagellar basal body P-ring formation chaperone FlgA [Chthonomonadaceae bacterium]|nr:flagellar basal body P-ring formation chaperone FlgA [Chthonomonadaceae bacterium]
MHHRTKRIPIGGLAALLCLSAQAQQTPGKPSVAKPATLPAKKAAQKPAESVVSVTVWANAEVSGRTFTLGEIADITGEDKALVAQLAAVEIGVSPLPTYARRLTPGDITVRLRAAHLDSKRVQVLAPPSIRVLRTGRAVGSDEITQAALAAAQSAIKDLPDATLEPIGNGGGATLPAGKVQIVAGAYRGRPEQGTLFVPVSLMVDGKPAQTVEVALRVRRKATVVVANRLLSPHDILSAEDVSLTTVELPPGFTQPVTDLKEAIGKRAARRILANTPIPASALETPPAIAANDRITIEYAFGSVRITAPGLARQSGAIGDTIRIYAPDTKRELDGVIVTHRLVRILDNEDDPTETTTQDDPESAAP